MIGTFLPSHDAFSAFQLDIIYLDRSASLLKRAHEHVKMLEEFAEFGLSNSANQSRSHQIGYSKHILYKFCFLI